MWNFHPRRLQYAATGEEGATAFIVAFPTQNVIHTTSGTSLAAVLLRQIGNMS